MIYEHTDDFVSAICAAAPRSFAHSGENLKWRLTQDQNAIKTIHKRVRRMYILRTRKLKYLVKSIDWFSIVDWLRENWDTILRVILAVLPLLI